MGYGNFNNKVSTKTNNFFQRYFELKEENMCFSLSIVFFRVGTHNETCVYASLASLV